VQNWNKKAFFSSQPSWATKPGIPKNERESHTAETRTMALDDKFAIDMNVIELETQEKSKSRPCLYMCESHIDVQIVDRHHDGPAGADLWQNSR
jgi:hypothetical protein